MSYEAQPVPVNLIGSLLWYSCSSSQEESEAADNDGSASETLNINYQTADTLRIDIDQKQEVHVRNLSQIRYLPLETIEEQKNSLL